MNIFLRIVLEFKLKLNEFQIIKMIKFMEYREKFDNNYVRYVN